MTDAVTDPLDRVVFWLSHPQVPYVEVLRTMGVRRLLLDLEHGAFDLTVLDQFLALANALGFTVLCKTAAPTTEAIQQALDFGASGVVVPHLGGLEHARAVLAAGKFPPRGVRSYSGGRSAGYTRAAGTYFDDTNRRVQTWAMIETAESLADVEAIAALDAVDGLFPGPSDLALARGRGAYAFTADDRADLTRIARAARAAGKPWIMPAWTPPERVFALAEGAERMVVASQHAVVRAGVAATLEALKKDGII
ncbi:MAG: HpcH/HpaI aldolase/citrate lyase family protein [Vicinamibacterales bacterium]